VEVYPGIKPSNSLFCRWYPVEGSEPLLHGPLQGPIVARSGDVLYLGRACAVQIPSKVQRAPLAPGECLALMLAVAKPGETVLLGRAGVPNLDGTVSRVHCSAKVLSKDFRDDGSFYMRVSAFPGIPGSEKVVLWRGNSQLEILESAAVLRTGDRIWFGEAVGDVTVPRLSS